ncbi:MAG TPA: NUMOD3 domain-containing DNA-binding protein, partial [Ktedonobacteraceae bacterium]
KRIYNHEQEARGTRKEVNAYKCRIIRKIWAQGEQIVRKKLAHFNTDEDALSYEIALIFFMNDLVNLTNGGEGTSGYTQSEEHRRKSSEARKGKRLTEEHRRKLSEAQQKRLPATEETRRKISDKLKGKPKSEEHRGKLSEINTGKHPTEETRRKMSKSREGLIVSEEARRKLSKAHAGKKKPYLVG